MKLKKTPRRHTELCNICTSKSLFKTVDLLGSCNLLTISAYFLTFVHIKAYNKCTVVAPRAAVNQNCSFCT